MFRAPISTHELANQALAIVTREVKSSHDIISFQQLPFLYPDYLPFYYLRFGEKKVKQYMRQSEHVEKVRSMSSEIFQKKFTVIPAPQSTLTLATSYCGVGECNELSQRALVELLHLGCEEDINLVLLKGMPRHANPDVGNPNDYYGHVLLVIGKIPERYTEDIESFFSGLSKDCVLLDPLLKVVGEASKTQQLIPDMIKHYQLTQVASITVVNQAREGEATKAIVKNAKRYARAIMARLQQREEKTGDTLRFFAPVTKPVRQPDETPVSLLVDERRGLDWKQVEERYVLGLGLLVSRECTEFGLCKRR